MCKVYELSLLPEATGVQISISKAAEAILKQYFRHGIRQLEVLQDVFGLELEAFVPFGEECFGYHGVLRLEEDTSTRIIVPFAQEHPLINLSASLFVLFRCMDMVERDARDRIEPMEISFGLTHGNSGCALFSSCSADFHSWLGEKYGYGTKTSIPIARESMLAAGDILRKGGSTGWRRYVRAEMLEVGGCSLHCDSNCCCMGGKGEMGESFDMSPHNSDSPWHQIAFFAGLAALSGQYLSERG